jgi:phosphoribosylanthranilate isomerase
MRVKVDGITNREDALLAVEAGAHALGFVFAPSPRQVSAEAAAEIVAGLPPFVMTVGVFVDGDVAGVLERCPLDAVQFHGEEPPEALAAVRGVRRIKAFRVATAEHLEALATYREVAEAFLLDARVEGVAGGTGQAFPWHLAREARRFGRPILLAGGLTAENVQEAIEIGRPDAVDVSSRVEAAPGRKDPVLVRRFVAAALGGLRREMGPEFNTKTRRREDSDGEGSQV